MLYLVIDHSRVRQSVLSSSNRIFRRVTLAARLANRATENFCSANVSDKVTSTGWTRRDVADSPRGLPAHLGVPLFSPFQRNSN